MSTKVQLRTERLLLRGYDEADVAKLIPLLNAKEVVVTTLRIPHPYTETNAREFVKSMREQEPQTKFGIFDASTGELYGGVGLMPEPQQFRAELGYWIGHPYWGRGYATEAAREVVRYGFETLKLNRIYAGVFQGNATSVHVLEKIGFSYEGTQRKHYHKWGKFLDNLNYGMLAEDWSKL
jgi:[ribosomal protein S5]-alanine N-acetyltransferase